MRTGQEECHESGAKSKDFRILAPCHYLRKSGILSRFPNAQGLEVESHEG